VRLAAAEQIEGPPTGGGHVSGDPHVGAPGEAGATPGTSPPTVRRTSTRAAKLRVLAVLRPHLLERRCEGTSWTRRPTTRLFGYPVVTRNADRLELEDPRVVLVGRVLVGNQLDITTRLRTDQRGTGPLSHERPVVRVADPEGCCSRLVSKPSVTLPQWMRARLHALVVPHLSQRGSCSAGLLPLHIGESLLHVLHVHHRNELHAGVKFLVQGFHDGGHQRW
jgi:hypothetical protein